MQALFRRGQLKALVDLHSTTEGMGGYLAEEEINVIRGALDLTGKQATIAMTPLDKVGWMTKCLLTAENFEEDRKQKGKGMLGLAFSMEARSIGREG